MISITRDLYQPIFSQVIDITFFGLPLTFQLN